MCAWRFCEFLAVATATISTIVFTQSATAEALSDEGAVVAQAGASSSDPLPVEGPSGQPQSLDDILASAGLTPPSTALPAQLLCFGNEPFWSLTVEGGVTAAYSTPEFDLPQSYTVEEAHTARGQQEYPIALELNAGLKSGLAVINYEACSDGMSDQTHLWSARIFLKDQDGVNLLTGCCRTP